MQQAVRLSCLHGIWCSALPEPKKTRHEAPKYASKAVHKQFAIIITQGIETLEYDILRQLQTLIFGQKAEKDRATLNEVPIWICLWLLMLTYRRTILHWSSRRNRDSYVELSQQMYNMLISTYSTLFRSTTPLWHDFLKEEIFERFGRDFSILERMGTIKTEMAYTRKLLYRSSEYCTSWKTILSLFSPNEQIQIQIQRARSIGREHLLAQSTIYRGWIIEGQTFQDPFFWSLKRSNSLGERSLVFPL